MTDTTTVGQWPDGWWKSVHMHYPPEYAVVRWETGQLAKYNSDNNGMIYEPVHVLTNAEYDALIAERDQLRQRVEALRAESEGWEDVNSSEWVFAENGARWAVCENGDVAVAYPDLGARAPLPHDWRIQRRKREEVGA